MNKLEAKALNLNEDPASRKNIVMALEMLKQNSSHHPDDIVLMMYIRRGESGISRSEMQNVAGHLTICDMDCKAKEKRYAEEYRQMEKYRLIAPYDLVKAAPKGSLL